VIYVGSYLEITLIFQRAETHIHPKSRSQRKTQITGVWIWMAWAD